MKVRKLIFMAIFSVVTVWLMYNVKSYMLSSMYSDMIFTRIAVESQEYTRQIEYGIENGKSLENFYNIDDILKNVKRCSSYINKTYIVYYKDDKWQFTLSDETGSDKTGSAENIKIRIPEKGSLYSAYYDENGDYFLSCPINVNTEAEGKTAAGYLVLSIDPNIVYNFISDNLYENLIQGIVIGVLAFLTGTIVIIHLRASERHASLSGFMAASITVCVGELADSFISIYRFWLEIDDLIRQSASNIVAALQSDLDKVIEKGVSPGRIYDLNAWLWESSKPIPFIEKFIYDKYYEISAVISDDYIMTQTVLYGIMLSFVIILAVITGLFFILMGGLADKVRYRRSRRDNKNGHKKESLVGAEK